MRTHQALGLPLRTPEHLHCEAAVCVYGSPTNPIANSEAVKPMINVAQHSNFSMFQQHSVTLKVKER